MTGWLATDRPVGYAALIGIAIGLLGNAYLLLGLISGVAFSPLGLLWPLLAASGLGCIAALGYRQLVVPSGPSRWLAAAALGPLLGVIALLCCLPPIARDELTHHLALPELYVRAGRIIEVPFADHAYYPMLLEMFYTPLLGWLPDNTPKVLHLLFGIAAASVIGLGAARDGGPRTGLLALVVTLATPVVIALAYTAYVDLGLMLYAAIALVALLRWFETRHPGWFAVSALSAGVACTTKYNGLPLLLLLAAGTGLAPWRRRVPAVAGAAIVYLLLGLAPWAPWLIKNQIQTGNPVFPLFANIFGGPILPGRPSVDIFTRRLVIHGESWLEIAAIPVRIFLTGREGSPARFDGVLNPIYLLGIAAACRRAARREHRLLLGFAAAYFAIAFFQTDMRVRYLLPIVPALALITAPAVTALYRRRPALAAAALAGGLAFSAAHVVDRWIHIAPLAYLGGHEDRSAYVTRFVPELPVLEYANAHLPPNSLVYLAFLGSRSYYCQRPFTYDTYFSGITLRQHVEATTDTAELLGRFRADGITHIIAADALLARYLADTLPPAEFGRWQAFAHTRLRRVASSNGVSLYEIG